MAYFLDRFGEDLTKAVVASQKNGVAGFDSALEQAYRPERLRTTSSPTGSSPTTWIRPMPTQPVVSATKDLDPYPPVLAETYRTYPVQALSASKPVRR